MRAADTRDLFLALGYVHAGFRLAEMDLERRLGEARLAQLAGPAAVAPGQFELRLGLIRTARAEWAQLRGTPAAQAYRAAQIYASLDGRRAMTPASFAAVQASLTGPLSRVIVPKLLAALNTGQLSAQQQRFRSRNGGGARAAHSEMARSWNGDKR